MIYSLEWLTVVDTFNPKLKVWLLCDLHFGKCGSSIFAWKLLTVELQVTRLSLSVGYLCLKNICCLHWIFFCASFSSEPASTDILFINHGALFCLRVLLLPYMRINVAVNRCPGSVPEQRVKSSCQPHSNGWFVMVVRHRQADWRKTGCNGDAWSHTGRFWKGEFTKKSYVIGSFIDNQLTCICFTGKP